MQTKIRGSNYDEYQIYLSCADDGNGGDITRNGAPLKTFDEWIAASSPADDFSDDYLDDWF